VLLVLSPLVSMGKISAFERVQEGTFFCEIVRLDVVAATEFSGGSTAIPETAPET
jgi:hypothetical protein